MDGVRAYADVITKFFRIHRFPIFFSYGAPLACGSSATNLHLYHEARSGHVGLLVSPCPCTWRVMQPRHFLWDKRSCMSRTILFKLVAATPTLLRATDHEILFYFRRHRGCLLTPFQCFHSESTWWPFYLFPPLSNVLIWIACRHRRRLFFDISIKSH